MEEVDSWVEGVHAWETIVTVEQLGWATVAKYLIVKLGRFGKNKQKLP